MVPKHEPRSKFGRWLLKYRLKLILFSFIVIVPTAFIIALYAGDYLKHKNVDFDGQMISSFKSTTIVSESETDHDMINLETNELLVQVKLIDYLIPEYYDDTNGHYTFKARHQIKSGEKINDITIKFIIQTEWIDAKSSLTTIPLTSVFGTDRKISFNHVLPQSPLWFVVVKHPYLYVEIAYDIELAMNQEERVTHYFKTYLGNLTTTKATDAEKDDK